MDVTQLVTDLGYLAVALAIFAEDFGLPAPGETVLVVALVLAAVIYWVRRSRRRLQDVRDEDSPSPSTIS